MPIPLKIFWLFLVKLHSEKPSVLEVHKSHHLLVPVVQNKDPSKVVKVSFYEAALSGGINTHGPENLHFVVLLGHLGFNGLRNILHFILVSHDTFLLYGVYLLIIHIPHGLSDMKGHIDMASGDFLGVDHIHLLKL